MLEVEIWSDIACPWCYVGKRRFETALKDFEHRDDVTVTWRSFELDPTAPRVREKNSYAERLASKYRLAVSDAQAMIDRMTAVGAEEGIEFRFDRIQAGNTFDAHRLLHLAAAHDRQDAMKERLLRAYFTEGAAIGEPEVLADLASEVGLDAAHVRRVLAGDEHADDVRSDEATAAELGIHGVPFFVIGRRYGVSGAQPASELAKVLAQAGPASGPGERRALGYLR